MKKNKKLLLYFIIFLTIVSIWIDLPREFHLKTEIPFGKLKIKNLNNIKIDKYFSLPAIDFSLGKFHFFRDLTIKKGIDLNGGTHLVFEADMAGITDKNSAIAAAAENIQRRVNLFGVTEASVQTSKLGENYRLIVELPVPKILTKPLI